MPPAGFGSVVHGPCDFPRPRVDDPLVSYYVVHMSTTLTIRTDEALREALAKRASAQGRTVSEVARDILRNALEERSLEERTSHLKGRLRLQRKQTEGWRRSLRERNWRD
jgi:plasmid stability protein